VTDEMVGAVLSITTEFAEVTAGGPAEVPVIEFAFNCKITDPSLQFVSVTVYVVPEPVSVGELQVEVPPS
jgi:hypothetical protein